MITKPKATKCRICGAPPYKGARCKECFNQAHKEQQAMRRANSGKKCACGLPMGAQAKRCRRCNGLDMAAHKQPRVYQKPPDDYKMKHMTKAEKREVVDVPVADTQDEKARYDALLERARANRVTCVIPRFEGDRECLLEGRG
jgi:hypothetical protein